VRVKELLKRTSAGSSCGCHFGSCSMRRTPFLSRFLLPCLKPFAFARLLSLKLGCFPWLCSPDLSLFPRPSLFPLILVPWSCGVLAVAAFFSHFSHLSHRSHLSHLSHIHIRLTAASFAFGPSLICRLTIFISSSRRRCAQDAIN